MGIRSFALRSFALVALATVSNSLLSLFKHERPWANRSCHSLKKSNHEQIALVALYKRVAWANRSCCSLNCSCCSSQKSGRSLKKSRRAKERKSETFVFLSELLFCSFAHKERAIRSKNQTVNSRPCYVIAYPPIHHIALLLLLSTVPGPLISTVPSPPISTVHSPLTTLCLALTLALS